MSYKKVCRASNYRVIRYLVQIVATYVLSISLRIIDKNLVTDSNSIPIANEDIRAIVVTLGKTNDLDVREWCVMELEV